MSTPSPPCPVRALDLPAGRAGPPKPPVGANCRFFQGDSGLARRQVQNSSGRPASAEVAAWRLPVNETPPPAWHHPPLASAFPVYTTGKSLSCSRLPRGHSRGHTEARHPMGGQAQALH